MLEGVAWATALEGHLAIEIVDRSVAAFCVALSVLLASFWCYVELGLPDIPAGIFSICCWLHADNDDVDDGSAVSNICCPKRRARLFKCVKRSARRKSQCSSKGEDWSCPFDCAFARIRMPAPLPFRRKKRPSPVKLSHPSRDEALPERKDETEYPVDEPGKEDQTEVSTSSDESITSAETEEKTASHKSKRRHRRKRRSSNSAHVSSVPSLPVSATTLIDLALMQNWPQLLVNVKAYRRQARYRDADGLYPLHWAVSGGPTLEVVRALLKAYPGATKKVDSEGSNALHFASHYGASVPVVELLLETYPKAISIQDKYGRSPLHHAVDKSANINVIKTLAMADPHMITESCRPTNYPSLEKEGKSWNCLTPLYLAWVNVLTDKRSVKTCSGKVWDKACLLLEFVYRHQNRLPNDVEVPVAAAIVALDALLPEELAAVAIRGVSSQELLKVDPISGMNPLAMVASSRKLSEVRSAELIDLMLDACPSAATAFTRDGKTALATAAASGRNWDFGLRSIFRAFPEALLWSDRTTGLLPPLSLAAASPQPADSSQRSEVMPADPYSLLGVKALSLQRAALEQNRERDASKGAVSEKKEQNQHLSSLFQLIKEDPSWILAAIG